MLFYRLVCLTLLVAGGKASPTGSKWLIGQCLDEISALCPEVDGVTPMYIPDPEECSYFCECDDGIAYKHDCPGNLLFDDVLNVCNWANQVNCGDRPCTGCSPTSTSPSITTTQQPSTSNYTQPPSNYTTSTFPPYTTPSHNNHTSTTHTTFPPCNTTAPTTFPPSNYTLTPSTTFPTNHTTVSPPYTTSPSSNYTVFPPSNTTFPPSNYTLTPNTTFPTDNSTVSPYTTSPSSNYTVFPPSNTTFPPSNYTLTPNTTFPTDSSTVSPPTIFPPSNNTLSPSSTGSPTANTPRPTAPPGIYDCPVPDGLYPIYFANPDDCHSFYECDDGVGYLQHCPFNDLTGDRLVFDPELDVCVYEWLYPCNT
ncbi:uncharacterized protein LOC143025521 isoform X2 [Oratosquilla oratoria]|uniref:uncharacterized protein LOC143025521 isoform X2 n=1 Tax=Oratosquilla oratoria TaxID=337810 RepID=UPI003F7624B8